MATATGRAGLAFLDVRGATQQEVSNFSPDPSFCRFRFRCVLVLSSYFLSLERNREHRVVLLFEAEASRWSGVAPSSVVKCSRNSRGALRLVGTQTACTTASSAAARGSDLDSGKYDNKRKASRPRPSTHNNPSIPFLHKRPTLNASAFPRSALVQAPLSPEPYRFTPCTEPGPLACNCRNRPMALIPRSNSRREVSSSCCGSKKDEAFDRADEVGGSGTGGCS